MASRPIPGSEVSRRTRRDGTPYVNLLPSRRTTSSSHVGVMSCRSGPAKALEQLRLTLLKTEQRTSSGISQLPFQVRERGPRNSEVYPRGYHAEHAAAPVAGPDPGGPGSEQGVAEPDATPISLYEGHQDKQELLRGQSGEYPAFESVTPIATPVVVPVSGQGGAQSEAEEYQADNKSFIGTCPDFGSQPEFAEGCVKCHVCGFRPTPHGRRSPSECG